ncbi:hypothetical protein CHS0354_034570 [Potamilus streckersoni]|uniref:Uncharacterized protein n=1 Tax=Potamilus streckersoni TaxID=2493646 RepID=A0AAE0RQU0_9BIVA|nr:hypothetical protein CHS0354_034570 [Potamilus streckersoni]
MEKSFLPQGVHMLHHYNNNHCVQESCKKRKLDNGIDMESQSSEDFGKAGMGRTFLPIRADAGVFQTDEWKTSGTAMFHPVLQDQYINLKKLDKISAGQGSFFTADESGNYSRNLTGNVLHLWRYDKQEKKLYISQSFLFTNFQVFLDIQSFLKSV